MMKLMPYQVYNPAGNLVLQADEDCRYTRLQERLLLENGYTIKLKGRKITKAEIKKEVHGK